MNDHLWSPWRMRYLKDEVEGGEDDRCIFCAKVEATNDAAEHILCRGEHCLVTLNLYPYNNGHLLVVPYQHTGKLSALPETTLAELMALTRQAEQVLDAAFQPDGFNIGINQGSAAGAGIAEHLHQHVVPRWLGDTNYMTVIGHTRVIPEWIDDTYRQLKAVWEERFPAGMDKET
jgi:ATP adenylyltransferase